MSYLMEMAKTEVQDAMDDDRTATDFGESATVERSNDFLTLSQILPIICDRSKARSMAGDTAKRILQRIYGHGRGWVFSPKDFLDVAGNAAVRQSLSRLKQQGTIRRLMQGIYYYPSFSNLLNAPSSPDPDAIAQTIARVYGWTILPTGDTALNLLGLSTQVPAQYQYFSDGPSKLYEWQGGILVFKHRTNKETTILSYRTALLVQALKSLGENGIDSSAISTLREKFSNQELSLALNEARYITAWVYNIIKKLAKEDMKLNA
jgi:hypothetical protein